MGSCLSAATGAAEESPPPPARVIADDGAILEFQSPARASDVLLLLLCSGDLQRRGSNSSSSSSIFVCSSDSLRYGGGVVPLDGGDELKPGRLYFVLPAPMQGRRLTGSDMAALAVRASDAINTAARGESDSRRRRRRRRLPMWWRRSRVSSVQAAPVHFGVDDDDDDPCDRFEIAAGIEHRLLNEMSIGNSGMLEPAPATVKVSATAAPAKWSRTSLSSIDEGEEGDAAAKGTRYFRE